MRMFALATLPLLAAAMMPASAVPAHGGGHGDDGDKAAGIVRLSGEQEAPEEGDPDGRGFFLYSAQRGKICYVLTAKKIETPTMAHIHEAPRGEAGPIVIGLRPPVRGASFDCIRAVPDEEQNEENANATLTESELAAIIDDPPAYYVNVHNEPFPAGAIRGQLR